ncbi:apolipoprotein L3 isoform X2 [Syngnathus acus]|uniref:apolipoprotein L3 isoform X2 n=1 Tax=Syngnathus acus TaxID=161584 RepID=UPI001885D076|nr:apolipoprotein L3 isoform X2 [Syngnathus acus]
MHESRDALKEILICYASATQLDMSTVSRFRKGMSEWRMQREKEIDTIRDIGNRAELKLGKNLLVYVKSKMAAENRRTALEAALAGVLKDVLFGLEELDVFVEALERLATTSLLVFRGGVVKLAQGVGCCDVAFAVAAARRACPLAAELNRDAKVFFLPRLDNTAVLAYLLDKYVQTAQQICLLLDKSKFCLNLVSKAGTELRVDLPEELSSDDTYRMFRHIQKCSHIRNDADFRLVFRLQEHACHRFLAEFSQRRARMLELLDQLDQNIEGLVRENKGVKLSNVASSTLGLVSGALSIAGLAFVPITAGTSLVLSMTGLGLGLASWANCAVTSVVDYKLKQKCMKKVSEVIENFIEDAECLDDITSETRLLDAAVSEVLCEETTTRSVGLVADVSSTVKTPPRNQEVATRVGKVVIVGGKTLRNVHRAVADARNVGSAALSGSVAVSHAARAGLIPLNGIFIGIDIVIICVSGVALAKGCETRMSHFLRARSALWRAEMESWQRMYDSLVRGLETFGENQAVLEAAFYLDGKRGQKQRCSIQ